MANTAKGAYQRFVQIDEATWGVTPATPSGSKMPISRISGDLFSQNLLPNPEIRGNRNPAAPVLGNKAVSFSVTAPLHFDAIGEHLKHAIGVPDTTGGPLYVHTGKVGFNEDVVGDLPAGCTCEVGYTDIDVYLGLVGCKINTMRVQAQAEGVTQFEFGYVGKTFSDPTGTPLCTPSEYTSDAISNFSGSIKEGGSTIAIVTSVDFNLNNMIDTSLYTFGGAGTVAELPENIAELRGSVTALFQSDALLAKAIAGTESSLQLTWSDGTNSLVFDIPELRYEPKAPTSSGDKGVMITLPFISYYGNHADASILKYTLSNDVASY